MTRNKRIAKLAHAILALRGKYDERTGKWFQPPQPHRVDDVGRWAISLGLDPRETLEKVESFHHVREYETWIKTL